MRRSLSIATLVLCVVTMLFAKGSTTTGATATFFPGTLGGVPANFGVYSDGGGSYFNGTGGVQSYIGSGGKDYDLVTYSTNRNLTITGANGQAATWASAGLPLSGRYQVDFYGVNFYGPYSTMSPGTTALVHGVLQFHYLSNTYQLDYSTLQVMKDASTGVYHLTSDRPEYSPVAASPIATLSIIRRKGNVTYGQVTMPIQFDMK